MIYRGERFTIMKISILLGLALMLKAQHVLCRPSLQECNIYLIASDTARDLSLNRDPEYIRFLNIISRTYLGSSFRTFDDLPPRLKATYKTWAVDENNEIDISAAMFNADATVEEFNNLHTFCNQTSEIIEEMMKETTPAPTRLSPTTPSPTAPFPTSDTLTSTTEIPTPVPKIPPKLTFDPRDVNASGGESSSSSSGAGGLGQLPIQCRRGIFGSDSNKDGFMDKSEYTTLVNRLFTTAYDQVNAFEELPRVIRKNFDNLATDERMNVYGAIPTEWSDATPQQRAFLQKLCTHTEAAIAVAGREVETPKDAPVEEENPAPSQTTDIPATTGEGDTKDENSDGLDGVSKNGGHPNEANESSRERLDGNAIAAIVGSVLIVSLVAYMAKDKRYVWRSLRDRLANLRKDPPPLPAASDGHFFSDHTSSSEGSHTGENKYDVETLRRQEETSFLEDNRIGTFCLDDVIEDSDEDHQASAYVRPTEKAEYNAAIFDDAPRKLERQFNVEDDFGQYGYDDSSIASSKMSLYCSSELGNEGSSSSNRDLLNLFRVDKRKDETARGSTSTSTTAHLTEHSGRFRYTPTRTPVNRFVRSDESDFVDADRLVRTSSTFSSLSAKETNQVTDVTKSGKGEDRACIPQIDEVCSSSGDESNGGDDAGDEWYDEPIESPFSVANENDKLKRPFRFLKYARGETESVSGESLSFTRGVRWPGTNAEGISERDHTKCRSVLNKRSQRRRNAPSGRLQVNSSWTGDDQSVGSAENNDSFSNSSNKLEDLDNLSSGEDDSGPFYRNPSKKQDRSNHTEQQRVKSLSTQYKGGEWESIAARKRPESKAGISSEDEEKKEDDKFIRMDPNEATSSHGMNSASMGSSFVDLSSEETMKESDFLQSDSFYEGSTSNSSTLRPSPECSLPEQQDSNENNHAALIYDLVDKVMPSEKRKIDQMLEQYKGREGELVDTLCRLEVRMNSQRASQINYRREINTASISRTRLENDQAMTLTSMVTANAELIAAANVSSRHPFDKNQPIISPTRSGDNLSIDSTVLESPSEALDFEASSVCEELTSGEDSTYYEDEVSTTSWSMFSVLK